MIIDTSPEGHGNRRKLFDEDITGTTTIVIHPEKYVALEIYYMLTLTPSGSDSALQYRLNGDSGNNYLSVLHYAGTNHSHAVNSGESSGRIGQSANVSATRNFGKAVILLERASNGYIHGLADANINSSASSYIWNFASTYNSSAEISSLTILVSNGTMAGRLVVYGIEA